MPLTQKKSPFEQLDSGASTTPVQKSHFFTGKQPAMAPTQKPQEGLFSGLSSGLEQSGEMGQQVNENVMGMLTGSAFDSHRTQQRETLQRAAQNLRAQTGDQASHLLGQGSANRAQQGVEQGILQSLSDSEVQTNIAQQEMQERGVDTALNLAQAQQQKNVQDQQLQMQRDELYGYTDPQGNHVMGARDLAQQMFNFEVDATGRKLDLAERQMLEQVRQFDTELDWRQKAKEMDLDEAETQRLWASKEANFDRTFQIRMQEINHEFAERGWNYQAFMQNLDDVDPEVVGMLLDNTLRAFDPEFASSIEGIGEARMEQGKISVGKVVEGQALSGEEHGHLLNIFKDLQNSGAENVARDFGGKELINKNTKFGHKDYSMTAEGKRWANDNIGKLTIYEGKAYIIQDVVESEIVPAGNYAHRDSYVLLRDAQNPEKTVKMR